MSASLVLAWLALAGAPSPPPASPPTSEALRSFEGDWTCSGHFEPSMKPLASTMAFATDPDTGALVKRHRDLAPGDYKANETWAAAGGGYRASIADAFSGLRWFVSPGWEQDRWTWTRVDEGAPAEAFVYQRTGAGRMTVEWWISRKGAPKTLGDTLACEKNAS